MLQLTKSLSRRRLLLSGVVAMGVGPLLQACGGAPASPTAAPKPTEAPKPAAEPTKPAAATPTTAPTAAPAAKPAEPTKPAAPTAAPTAAAAPAKPSIKIEGNLVVLQERGYNPNQTTFIHNLLIRTAAQFGWPLDKSYKEGYTGGTNFQEKFAASVKAGDSPDLFIPGTESVFLLWYLKTLSPVDDIVQWAEKEFGKTVPAFKLANNIEGKWWAVPIFTATGGYWARKSWFDAIKFDTNVPHNLQEWLEASLAVSDPANKKWGWGNTVNRSGDGWSNVMNPVWGAGGRFADENNNVVFNSEFTITAFEWLKDVYTNPKWAKALPTGVNSWTDPSNNEAYLAGTIGFSSNGGTMFATAVANKPDIAKDTVLVPHPAGPVGKKETHPFGPGLFNAYIPAGAKNPEAARELIKTLLSKENQKAIWKNSPGHSVPAYEWGWDEPEANTAPNDVAKIFKKIAYDENVWFTFRPLKEPKLWIDAIAAEAIPTDVMAEILKGTPVKEAVANGHKRIEAVKAKYEGK